MDSVTRALLKEFVDEHGLQDLEPNKQFEHFAAFSLISARHSDDFETDDLVTQDGADLNIDAFAIKVNGHLAIDADTVDDLLALNGVDVSSLLYRQSRPAVLMVRQ
jgi:hypothetical protein